MAKAKARKAKRKKVNKTELRIGQEMLEVKVDEVKNNLGT